MKSRRTLINGPASVRHFCTLGGNGADMTLWVLTPAVPGSKGRAALPTNSPDDRPSAEPAPAGTGPPAWTPALPPLAGGFIPRPETGATVDPALFPGTTTLLVTEQASPGRRNWRDACGKTQLAVAAAWALWQGGAVDLVVWVTASSRAAALSCYAEAARARGGLNAATAGDAEAVAARFIGWLRETPQSWLVVLDGLTAEAALDDRLWPSGPTGRVLVTAGDPQVLGGRPARTIPVRPYSPREALNYLIGRLTMDVDQRQGAVDLTAELGYEPLALAQAAAVIASSELSCHDYLEHFLHRRGQMSAGASGTVAPAAITWGMSIDQADMMSPGISQSLLPLTAMFDGTAIPAAVFATGAARAYCSYSMPDRGERTIRDGLTVLESAGLLTADRGAAAPFIRMSWPVQAAVRASMPKGMLKGSASAAADALLEAWPAEDADEALTRSLRSCAASLREAAGNLLWEGGCHPVLLRAGRSLEAAQLNGPAAAYWEDLAATSTQLLGQDHPSTSGINERLARCYLASGRAGEAISLLQAIRSGRITRLGPEHPGTLEATRGLGLALVGTGRHAEAITILTQAVDDWGRSHDPGGASALLAREDLAAAHRAAGQYKEAIAAYRAVLSERERAQGARHADTTATRQQLADTYLAAGQAKAAISQYERVAGDRERTLGADHPLTIAARGALGSAYHSAGRMASAVRFGDRTRADYTRVLGADHPDTLAACLNLAHAYYGVGRITDAARLLQETVQRCELSLPAFDPLTSAARDSLTNISGTGG
jgi:tetratricopeptide (TPR) repeat protein